MATVRALAAKSPPVAEPEPGSFDWYEAQVERGRRDGPFTIFGPLTPALAEALLQRHNDSNRQISPAKSARYAADITSGRWAFNGETLIVADDGHVNDGQHRCKAVVMAETSINVIWVFGVPRETRHTLDQGRSRSAADVLSVSGVKSANLRAAIARAVIAYDTSGGKHTNRGRHLSVGEICEYAVESEAVATATDFTTHRAMQIRRLSVGSVIGMVHVILSRIDAIEAENFLDKLLFGENLTRGTAIYALRDKLMAERVTQRDQQIALILRAWNFNRRDARDMTPRQLVTTLPFPKLRTMRGEQPGEAYNSDEVTE